MGLRGKGGYGEKRLDSGYIWKVGTTGFAGILFMECEKENPRKAPVYLAWRNCNTGIAIC